MMLNKPKLLTLMGFKAIIKFFYFSSTSSAKYCNHGVGVSVCLSLCSHISKTICPNFSIFCACYLWPRLGPSLTIM